MSSGPGRPVDIGVVGKGVHAARGVAGHEDFVTGRQAGCQRTASGDVLAEDGAVDFVGTGAGRAINPHTLEVRLLGAGDPGDIEYISCGEPVSCPAANGIELGQDVAMNLTGAGGGGPVHPAAGVVLIHAAGNC